MTKKSSIFVYTAILAYFLVLGAYMILEEKGTITGFAVNTLEEQEVTIKDSRSEFLETFGGNVEIDEKELFLAPVVEVNARTYSVSEKCEPYYECTENIEAKCLVGNTNSILKGELGFSKPSVCLATPEAPLDCPKIYRRQDACTSKDIIVERGGVFTSPPSDNRKVIATKVLDEETKKIIAELGVEYDDNGAKKVDVILRNGI